MNRITGWVAALAVIAFLAATAHPVNVPASCEGKAFCLFITE